MCGVENLVPAKGDWYHVVSIWYATREAVTWHPIAARKCSHHKTNEKIRAWPPYARSYTHGAEVRLPSGS